MSHSDNKGWRSRGKVPFYRRMLTNKEGMRKFRGKNHCFAITTIILESRQKSSVNSKIFLENRVFHKKIIP